MNKLPDGLIIVCKEDCPTCTLIEPVYKELAQSTLPLTIYSQDNPDFPGGIDAVIDDSKLETSYWHNIEIVPTLLKVKNGVEVKRTIGWDKQAWREFTGLPNLGRGLPDFRPGCGSLSVEPGIEEKLAAQFGSARLRAKRLVLAELEDDIEACYEYGWTDGLPVIPPTEARVMRMLAGTTRPPNEVVGIIPPDNAPCTVEKVAINAVMAGCKPAYMPVALAAVKAACLDEFCMHGLLATTYFSGPVLIVNGPITTAIKMNSGVNALGQGNRANATIGRTLQLIIRNVGGGKPGQIDRATLGNPGKYTFCFAEDETGSPWESLAVERGFEPDVSTVTLFAGDGVQAIFDQLSRTPESLAKSFAHCLQSVAHPKIGMAADAMLVVSPEHGRIFKEAGWSKANLKEELNRLLQFPGTEMIRGAGGIAEGIPVNLEGLTIPKFRPGGLHIVHAGGTAGLFSAIIGGWVASGPMGSESVTVAIES